MESQRKNGELDDFHTSVVLKELQPGENLLFARLEDPMPRILTMSRMLAAVVLFIMIIEIYVKHHEPPSLSNSLLFLITWVAFMLLFKRIYKSIDAVTNQRFLRVRPGISVHYGWLKDIERIEVSKQRSDGRDLNIFLKETGKYEARNLRRPELKPRTHHGVKKFTISNLQAAPQLKSTIEDSIAFGN